MRNEFGEQDEFHSLPDVIRTAFKAYPRPKANAEFDARFWRELDVRQHRYRGFAGFWRRLIEVEIEGIAVWRLGASTCAGALFCTLGFAVFSYCLAPATAPAPPVPLASVPETPLAAPRFARSQWEDPTARSSSLLRPPALPRPTSPQHKPTPQEKISCVSFAPALA